MIRIDQLLVERSLIESSEKAQTLIIAGEVEVNGETVNKPSRKFETSVEIRIKELPRYVSRGGLKLEHAIKFFGIDIKNKICLDIGSSTGGFVDCLLQHGVKKAYAVDVGKGLLHWKLRKDPRVVLFENINFRYFDAAIIKEYIELVTIDVSFISLEKILPKVKELSARKMDIFALVKPQFEVERKYAPEGVVRDKEIQISTVNKIANIAEQLKFKNKGFTTSHTWHLVSRKSFIYFNGDSPMPVMLTSLGNITGRSFSFTGMAPHLSQYIIGMGVPQYLCLEINQSFKR